MRPHPTVNTRISRRQQVGHHVDSNVPDVTDLITLPRLRIEGPWFDSAYIEFTETSYIQSSSGWLSTIKYRGKGYFSGKSHTFKTDLTPPIGSGSGFHGREQFRGPVERHEERHEDWCGIYGCDGPQGGGHCATGGGPRRVGDSGFVVQGCEGHPRVRF